MRYLFLYIVIALAMLLLPKGTDASKLAPAELVYVSVEDGMTQISTDLGNSGRGRTLAEAFKDLENTTPGKVFLDTAEYLLIDREMADQLPQLKEWLKGNCLICLADGVEDMEGAARYLTAHPPGTKLKSCDGEAPLTEMLQEENGRFCLSENKSKKDEKST